MRPCRRSPGCSFGAAVQPGHARAVDRRSAGRLRPCPAGIPRLTGTEVPARAPATRAWLEAKLPAEALETWKRTPSGLLSTEVGRAEEGRPRLARGPPAARAARGRETHRHLRPAAARRDLGHHRPGARRLLPAAGLGPDQLPVAQPPTAARRRARRRGGAGRQDPARRRLWAGRAAHRRRAGRRRGDALGIRGRAGHPHADRRNDRRLPGGGGHAGAAPDGQARQLRPDLRHGRQDAARVRLVGLRARLDARAGGGRSGTRSSSCTRRFGPGSARAAGTPSCSARCGASPGARAARHGSQTASCGTRSRSITACRAPAPTCCSTPWPGSTGSCLAR